VGADGAKAVTVLNDGYENFIGAWSPNGKRLAFSSDRGGDLDVYTIGSDGRDLRRLVGGRGAQAVNAWLPDGGILFADSPPDEETTDWKTVRPDGSGIERLAFLDGAADPLDWRPAARGPSRGRHGRDAALTRGCRKRQDRPGGPPPPPGLP
jgi:hypothetical protein